jgi:hypothetical protein
LEATNICVPSAKSQVFRMQEGDPKVACFRGDAEGTLWFKERLVVPRKETLKKKILDEAHTSRYSIHLGSIKMYHDLRQRFHYKKPIDL